MLRLTTLCKTEITSQGPRRKTESTLTLATIMQGLPAMLPADTRFMLHSIRQEPALEGGLSVHASIVFRLVSTGGVERASTEAVHSQSRQWRPFLTRRYSCGDWIP